MALTLSEQRKIARRYAQAGYDVSKAAGDAEKVLESLFALEQVITSSDVLKRVLNNPLPAKAQVAAVLAAVLGKVKAPKSALQMVNVVVENGRAPILPLIAKAFQACLDADSGVVRGELISAQPLDQKTVEDIAKSLSTKERSVKLNARTDESLLGGLRLHLGSQMVDASVAGRLSRIKRQLTQPISAESSAT